MALLSGHLAVNYGEINFLLMSGRTYNLYMLYHSYVHLGSLETFQ